MGSDPDTGGAFFDDDYYRLLEPFHPESEARAETAALRELLGLAQTDRILDLGCGWGRHLALLREAGHSVVGLDLSLPLLRRAADTAADAAAGRGTAARRAADQPRLLVAGTMLRLPFADGLQAGQDLEAVEAGFDVVLNLATSLGLFLEDAPARAALSEARRVLRPGGQLLVEGMHRDDVVAHFAPRDRWRLEDGTEVRVRRRFDALRGVSEEVLRWRGPGGAGEKRHALRIRSATELAALLERAGLEVEAAYGDWEGGPFRHDSDRLILLASSAGRPRRAQNRQT